MKPSHRILDLAKRLVATGTKCCHVSASETHEITDFILSLDAPTDPEGRTMNDTETNGTPEEQLDCWAIVELFGHNKIAGKIKTVSLAGGAMLRVDVPAVTEQKAYTRFFGNKAIYSINPVSEAVATGMVSQCHSAPVKEYELPKMLSAPQPDHLPLYPEHDPEEHRD